MAAKKKGKGSKKKSSGGKVSLAKISNKRLNRLAKQGKLKKARNKKHVLSVLKQRVHAGPIDPEQQEHEEQQEQEERENQDIPLEEADYEYFATHERNFTFLREWQEESETKPRRKKKRLLEKDDHGLEVRYEKNRKVSNEPEMRPLLPIKGKQGLIPQQEEVKVESENEHPGEGELMNGDGVPEPEPLPALSTAEIMVQRKQKLEQRKRHIALLSANIIENPERQISSLRELRQMLAETDPDVMVTVRKFAMASLLEVFKDILPAYRIRMATQKEKEQSASKETKKLREYEEGLVSNYKHYLAFLEICLKGDKSEKKKKKWKQKHGNGLSVPKEARGTFKELGLRCLCDLLSHNPNFNFRTNIISLVVPFMNHKNQKLSDMVCFMVKKLFREDKAGDVTLEVVRLIGRMIKSRNFNVQPKVLSTFLSLKIKEVNLGNENNRKDKDETGPGKNKRKFMSKREKKRKKQMVLLEKELEDAAVVENKGHKLKLHTEVINMVFLTYFRILKQACDSALLAPVLEGLAKFAHLINLEFFDDLFSVLNELVNSGELEVQESLHCVKTAFTMLAGQGAVLNIDPINFFKHLYATVLKLDAGTSTADLKLALACLDVMVNRRRKQVSLQRLLAFIKRLATVSMTMENHGALGIMATIRTFLHANPKTDLLFDPESLGSGMYLPELNDPEHCNAGNTVLWELHMLRHHYHPVVRKYATHLCAGAPSQGNHQLTGELARKNAQDLLGDYDSSSMMFNPQIPGKATGKKKQIPRQGLFLQPDVETLAEERLSGGSSTIPELDFAINLLNEGRGHTHRQSAESNK